MPKDIYTQTELVNLIVVSKTRAKALGVDIDHPEYEYEHPEYEYEIYA